jgi:hypothetical protein
MFTMNGTRVNPDPLARRFPHFTTYPLSLIKGKGKLVV